MNMDKLYYSIGEAAGILGENVSLVRFWTDSFPEFLHPRRNAKGNRMYRAEDVETLKKIHFLVKDCGLTLEGAAKKLRNENQKVDGVFRAVEVLRQIKARLEEVRSAL